MITRERLIEVLTDEDRMAFQTKEIDHTMKAVSLLRERIPYKKCKSIIQGAGHDEIYLPDIDEVFPYISEEDLDILVDCNVMIDEDSESLALFV